MDNLNTPDNMSKNTHTKLFKSQFSGASGNKTFTARKPLKHRAFGQRCFYGLYNSRLSAAKIKISEPIGSGEVLYGNTENNIRMENAF